MRNQPKPKKIQDTIDATKQYILFLEKRLNSQSYKNNVSKEEYAETKEKYDKAKLRVKLLSK
jgi:hypothetical protein